MNLGNLWHITGSPEPRGRSGMRTPVGAITAGTAVTVSSGNQYQGGGNAGNQLQDGSTVLYRVGSTSAWMQIPMQFQLKVGNNAYYAATFPAGTFSVGDIVHYYFRVPFDDHDTTFVAAAGVASRTTGDEDDARNSPFEFAVTHGASSGEWGPVFELPNAAIHATLLPTGEVLMWGRRDRPDQSLDEHECTPFLWHPETGRTRSTPQPTLHDNTTKVNLFCAGHSFLADGRLLVVGGHLADGDGPNLTTVYDPNNNTWTPSTPMRRGRWYPSATTLPDGDVLVLSGSYHEDGQTVNNRTSAVWSPSTGGWRELEPMPPNNAFELYPRTHLAADGSVFMSGPLVQSWTLSTDGSGSWTPTAMRQQGRRDYASSVLYDENKVLYAGGGTDADTKRPTAAAEVIDLAAHLPSWRPTAPMTIPRRQHNATLLPDGTILVTGGTRGMDFNDLGSGEPAHPTEAWNPVTEEWTILAAEAVDRCYHSTATLLPDATVLSAGGGEYRPWGDGRENDPQDTHRDAQIFRPPYLFKGPRPEITSCPDTVGYGEAFHVDTPHPHDIHKISWVGLSSVTHSINFTQRICFPSFAQDTDRLRVTAPESNEICPPGPYLMFALSASGVPSIAKLLRISGEPPVRRGAGSHRPRMLNLLHARPATHQHLHQAPTAAVAPASLNVKEHAVLLGITGTCPYGLGACWGGANEALSTLSGVREVDPIADTDTSTATVYLEDDHLPDITRWREEFRRLVGGSYDFRGVEMTLTGPLERHADNLYLAATGNRGPVRLVPMRDAHKIQWDRSSAQPAPVTADEETAFERLAGAEDLATKVAGMVTGPLKQLDNEYLLCVRTFRL